MKRPNLCVILAGVLTLVALVGCSSPASNLDEQQAKGKQVFTQFCASCHSTLPDTVIVGPSLAGIATRAETRVAGMDAGEYILESITNPEAYLNEGYNDLMPKDFEKRLRDDQLDALLAYLLTLK